MDQNALVNDLVKRGAAFLEEFEKLHPIAVAFWLKNKGEKRWHLHVASEKLDDAARYDAYADVIRIANELSFGPSFVRLRKIDEKIVQWALAYQHRHPSLAAVFDVPSFYGVEVEGMYLYPPMKAAA
jgi:hypothetical protein